MGSRIELTEELLGEIERLASRGLTCDEIARSLGIARSSFFAKKRASKEFREAFLRGRAQAKEVLTNVLFDLAKSGNVAAGIFLCKAMFGMRDHGPATPEDGETEEVKPGAIVYRLPAPEKESNADD